MQIELMRLALVGSLLLVQCTEAKTDDKKTNQTNNKQLVREGKLPIKVPESSGLANAGQSGVYYTMGDAGNAPFLYKFSQQGELLDQIQLPFKNRDWESLSEDKNGNIYIADCGNNSNSRRDLALYKVNPAAPSEPGIIQFSYPDQKDFPPKKKNRNFDCEGTLWHNNAVYLFTRDRGKGKTCNVYSVPDQAGQYLAKQVAELEINAEITGADLSPDGTKLALIAKERLFLFTGEDFASALKAKPTEIPLPGTGQTEGVLFINNDKLLISSEEGGLYSYQL